MRLKPQPGKTTNEAHQRECNTPHSLSRRPDPRMTERQIPRLLRSRSPARADWLNALAGESEKPRAHSSRPSTSIEPGRTHRRHHGTVAANGIARSQPHWRCVRELAVRGSTRRIEPRCPMRSYGEFDPLAADRSPPSSRGDTRDQQRRYRFAAETGIKCTHCRSIGSLVEDPDEPRESSMSLGACLYDGSVSSPPQDARLE